MAAVALAGATASLPAAAAPPPAAARARHTTQALRAVRPLVSITELGMLHELVRAGLSFETGMGIISYSRLAVAARLSRRQVMRYIKRFEARGIVVVQRRYWHTVRPTGDVNRANQYFLPIPNLERAALDSDSPPEAFEDEDLVTDYEPPPEQGAVDAQAASTPAPAPTPADTRPGSEKPAARAAAVSSCTPDTPPPNTAASSPAEGTVEACILGKLRSFHELASVADVATAERLASVASRNGKSLVLVEAAIAAAVDKAAGRSGRELESFLASLIRAEDGRSLRQTVQSKAPPSREEKARQREEEEARTRRLQERETEERRKKLAALRSDRGPP